MKNTKTFRKFIVLLFISTSLLMPVSAGAVSNSVDYQPQTVEEMIAYLYGIISQLQAMIDAQEDNGYIGVPQPGNTGRAEKIEVTTQSAQNIEEDEADLEGKIDLNGERYAYVWFEYGEDSDYLDKKTGKAKVYRNNNDIKSFSSNIHGLNDDEKYYFRAVAEDSKGKKDYGSVKSFTTDDDCCGGSSGDYDLTVSDYSIDEGDEVHVYWDIPSRDTGSKNWIGLFEEGDSNRQYISYEYIDNDDSGYIKFEIDDSGDYEFRLFLDNSYDDVATTRIVKVD